MSDENIIHLSLHHIGVLYRDIHLIIGNNEYRSNVKTLYGIEFLENVDNILERLSYPETEVVIVDGPDDMCKKCHDGVRASDCIEPASSENRHFADNFGIMDDIKYPAEFIASLIF
jgi:hypothetical protein